MDPHEQFCLPITSTHKQVICRTISIREAASLRKRVNRRKTKSTALRGSRRLRECHPLAGKPL